jgi:glycosyltransferase involved in cell wall biosynthesis
MAPYATVIVPTHDRIATLAVTVASVQRQTVQEIEIIISGDGATADVTNAAHALAAQDSRVRFLEFEKAPGSGGENRDRAIREFARAERIFYTDDDDLWLPQHIETIGLQLDHFDVVDTLPVSATACGRLALTCVNSASQTTRSLLMQDKLQSMYDTHLAHRRSTYLALGGPWRKALGGDVVFKVLGTFAAANVSWLTLPIATAISLHGGARATNSSTERQAEIVAWSSRLKEHTPQMLTADAHPAWPFFYGLNLFPPEAGDTLYDYLRRLGMKLPRDGSDPGLEADLLTLPLDQAKCDEMETTFALHRGDLVDTARIISVAPVLLDTVKVAVSSWPFLRRALRRLPLAKALTLVQSLPRSDPRTGELLAIFEVYLRLWARQPKLALPLAERLAADVRFVPHEAELLLGEVHLALGNFDEGFSYLGRAAARENRGSAISGRLAVAFMKAGRIDDARVCLERIESRLGGLPHTVALRRQLTALEIERRDTADSRL